MLKYIGLERESGEFDFTAYSDVSSLLWSKEAYNNLLLNGYRPLMHTDYGDDMIMDDDTYTIEPAREVTRYECAEFLYLFIVDFFQNNAPAIKRDTAPAVSYTHLDVYKRQALYPPYSPISPMLKGLFIGRRIYAI